MKELYTEIEINAPAEKVWEILMNFERHPDWDPFIQKITGKTEVGKKMDITITIPINRPIFTAQQLILEEEGY